MLLSFVIPVYNCSRYLRGCVGSILCQAAAYCEVLLINDGSKDNSLEICRELAGKDSRVKVFTQENRGASSARNVGLDNATGDFVWFVDADDSVAPFGKIIECLRTINDSTDMLVFGHENVGAECSEVKMVNDCQYSVLSFLELTNARLYLWNNIYRRSAIGELRFLDGTKNIEDFLFNIEFLVKISERGSVVKSIPFVGYRYNNVNEQSTSRGRSKRNLVKLTQDSIAVHSRLKDCMQGITDDKILKVVANLLNISVSGHLYSLLTLYNAKQLRKAIGFYRKVGLYPVAKTTNERANRFMTLMNRAWLVVPVYYLYHFALKVKRGIKL